MAEELLIRMRLQYDDEFAVKCLLKLYELQEADEQDVHSAVHRNGVGFNKSDAPTLTGIANLVKLGRQIDEPHKRLHADELQVLHELLPKYAKQLSRYLTEEEVEG